MEPIDYLVVGVVVFFLVVTFLYYFKSPYTKDESISYWIGQYVSIEPNYRITKDGIAELTIKNNWGSEIEVLDISFDGKGYINKEINLKNGEAKDVVVYGIPKCIPNSNYNYKVSILYKDVRSERNFLIEGSIPLVGKCE